MVPSLIGLQGLLHRQSLRIQQQIHDAELSRGEVEKGAVRDCIRDMFVKNKTSHKAPLGLFKKVFYKKILFPRGDRGDQGLGERVITVDHKRTWRHQKKVSALGRWLQSASAE